MTDQAVSTFQQNLRGRLVRPTDADYDAVRALYNGMIDKRPRLIARAVDAADVITAVNFAREQGLLLAIRGGGHNGPGLGSCNDGLVIDLSMMKSVRVDPGEEDRAGRARLQLRRRRPRDARLRAGRAVRHRQQHRCRRAHARRRYRVPHAQVRAHDRQPPRGRRRAGRRQLRHGERERASGPVLGAPRRRRQLRRRHELPVPGAPGEHGLSPARSSGTRRRTGRR